MSLPSGNAVINYRNLAYLQSLGPGSKVDPQKIAETLDDIQTAFSSLASRISALEAASVSTPTSTTEKASPVPFVVGSTAP